MEATRMVLTVAIIAATALGGWALQRRIGPRRAWLAAVLRLLWLLPMVLSLWPRTSTKSWPESPNRQTIHALIDDSASMQVKSLGRETNLKKAQVLADELQQYCLGVGCRVEQRLLSELDASVRTGVTPLLHGIERWQAIVGEDPWVLLSDGGDEWPAAVPQMHVRGLEQASTISASGDAGLTIQPAMGMRGLVVGFGMPTGIDIALNHIEAAPYGFEGRPTTISVNLDRRSYQEESDLPPLTVQVQALVGEDIVAQGNVTFAAKELTLSSSLSLPPMARGQRLVRVRILPPAEDQVPWDNEATVSLDIMPNTLGVLHLLGGPSWDGRYMRRLLKAEPKFDVISFFILRDPWDDQGQVNERELSLIPFPVERLFRDELPNFRVLILQNFTLSQFLQPEFQGNLVQFVQQGGGLLFVGGPRSLAGVDVGSSPLRGILPFDFAGGASGADSDDEKVTDLAQPDEPNDLAGILGGMGGMGGVGKGPIRYDVNAAFHIKMATPPEEARALASVFDEWRDLAPALSREELKGIHRLGRLKVKDKDVTPLLNARLNTGEEVPLALASYPGKGRALWLLSDAWWQMALSNDPLVPRQTHSQFLSAAMAWLMRQDIRRPLAVQGLQVSLSSQHTLNWHGTLSGPAAAYFSPESRDWQVSLCGVVLSAKDVQAEHRLKDEWLFRGQLRNQDLRASSCTLQVTGEHPAFGRITARDEALISRPLTDQEIRANPRVLDGIVTATGAAFVLGEEASGDDMTAWLQPHLRQPDGGAVLTKTKTERDDYWPLASGWMWLALFALPAEVIVRRWHLLRYG